MSGGNGSHDFSGVYLPVTTPFDPVTGDLDVVAYRANLRHWFRSPIRGILTAGSTGESVFLDDREKLQLIEAARDVVPAEGLLIAGADAESTRGAIEAIKAAADTGADAVLVRPPAYYKGAMTPEVLARHYKAVADAAPVPVLIYQVPLRLSTLEFPTALIGELSRHPNIVGIKDSRGKLDQVGELVDNTADDFQVLVGSGAILYGALELGAVGGIVAVGLMATAEAAEIYHAFKDGRTSEAGRIQERIAPVHNGIVGGMGVPGVKAALDQLGLHGGQPRAPLAAPSEAQVEEIGRILAAAELGAKAGV